VRRDARAHLRHDAPYAAVARNSTQPMTDFETVR
jgi:hypothetical protein